ncbi:hypothetical protein [Nitrospira sp. KM1]|uniref:hypothetical protein n=1 Tax=Nitrospira sp. KM1 TaxID=1936990 RepID=UPI001566EB3F|nr:hypothetical protein [Nitrospira sp. KM1]
MLVILAGCTPFHLSDMYSVSTPKPAYPTTAVLAEELLGTFSTVAPAALQGYGPVISHALSEALRSSAPPFHEIPPIVTINQINAKGLFSDYGEMMAGLSRTGMFDRRLLDRVGTALGSKYMLQSGLADFKEAIGDRFMFAGWRLVKTRATTLRLWLRLWDVRTGEILWEATGEATVTSELIQDTPTIPVHEIARRLWSRILQEHLIGDKTKVGFTLRDDNPVIRQNE